MEPEARRRLIGSRKDARSARAAPAIERGIAVLPRRRRTPLTAVGVARVPRAWRRVPWLAAPALIVVTGSMLFAVVQVVRLSVTDASFLGAAGASFVGLHNYADLFSDPTFREAVARAVGFTVLSVAGQLVFATALALLAWRETRLLQISRALIGVPWAVPPIVVAIIWRFLYQPQTGPLGDLLSRLGLEQGILGSPRWALLGLAVVNIWEFTPLYFLFISAGLRGLNRSVLDAGRVDGAGDHQMVRYLVLPQLRPLLVSLAVFNVLSTLGLFDLIWVMTQGGPGQATETASLFVYRGAFQNYVLGSSAAAVVIMTVLGVVLSVLVATVGGKRQR